MSRRRADRGRSEALSAALAGVAVLGLAAWLVRGAPVEVKTLDAPSEPAPEPDEPKRAYGESVSVFAETGSGPTAMTRDPSPQPTPACLAAQTEGEVPSGVDWGRASAFSVARTTTSGSVVDAADQPVPDVRLRFWRSDVESPKDASTDEHGVFRVSHLAAGAQYDVDVVLSESDGSSAGSRRIHAGSVTTGDRDVVLRIPIARRVLASGTIITSEGETPRGWSVVARRRDQASTRPDALPCGKTDESGRFRISVWSETRAELEAFAGSARRSIVAQDVDPATGDLRITVGPRGISGHVFARGVAAAGAVVRLRHEHGAPAGQTVTDWTGWYEFTQVDPGGKYVAESRAGPDTTVFPYDCSMDSGDVTLALFAPSQILEGRVLEPAANVWLLIVRADGTYRFQTMTNPDGTFLSNKAADADFDVFLLIAGPDGRLVPGRKVARCRGGDRRVEIRLPR